MRLKAPRFQDFHAVAAGTRQNGLGAALPLKRRAGCSFASEVHTPTSRIMYSVRDGITW
jgi:hypothetical protein